MYSNRTQCLIITLCLCGMAYGGVRTNAVQYTEELDGTNGYAIAITSSSGGDFILANYRVGYIGQSSSGACDALLIGGLREGSTYMSAILFPDSNAVTAVRDFTMLNGSNGFIVEGTGYNVAERVWTQAGGTCYWLSATAYLPNEKGGLALLNLTAPQAANRIHVTSDIWAVSARMTDERWQPVQYCTMAGNFLGDGLALAGVNRSNQVIIAKVATYGNYEEDITWRSNDILLIQDTPFIAGVPWYEQSLLGFPIAQPGDVNGDGYADILLGHYSSDNAWLVFGGPRSYTTLILTAGVEHAVEFRSAQYPKPPLFTETTVGDWVSRVGDVNRDGIDDIMYSDSGDDSYYLFVHYGRTNWPSIVVNSPANADGHNGFMFDLGHGGGASVQVCTTSGDVNGDGWIDFAFLDTVFVNVVYVLYGGPFTKPCGWYFQHDNGVKGFEIDSPDWSSGLGGNFGDIRIDGDENGDGYDDVFFLPVLHEVATNYAYVVYGGQSPSVPPQIRRPQWINIGGAGTQSVEWTDMPTNIVWTGCKKGDDYCLAYTNGVRCDAYDLPMDMLYFTNSYTLNASNELFTIAYTSTNALGPAAGMTSLTLHAVPEAGMGGLLLGIIMYTLQCTIWGEEKIRCGNEFKGGEAIQEAGYRAGK